MIIPEPFLFTLQAASLLIPILLGGIGLILILRLGWLQQLAQPVDFSMQLNGKRLLGDNKTWLGVTIYVLGAIFGCFFLSLILSSFPNSVHPVFATNPFILGLTFSISYVAGELINSFYKRRIGIAPGKSHPQAFANKVQSVIDNVDGIIATSLALVILYSVSIQFIFAAAIAGVIVHYITDQLMKILSLK